jgi:hypothetical protein
MDDQNLPATTGEVPAPLGQEQQLIIPPISRQRQVRIKEVCDLYNSGWTAREISLLYDLNIRQIFRDLKDGKIFNRFRVANVDADDIVGREIRLLEQSRRKELRKYETATNPMAAASHMRNAIVLHEKLIKLLQDYGLMGKVPERFSLESSNPFDDPEFREEYKKLMIRAREKGVKIDGL